MPMPLPPESHLLRDQIAAGLLALGVRPGGVLLVHSSLRSLGLPPGLPERAELAVAGLLAALGPAGTLLMPALSYETVHSRQPVFDVARTPSCVGGLTEYFRTRPGTLRSVHPTHSVCGLGPRVEELLSGHQSDATPCGPRSPFSRLPRVGGQVLFLGCGMRPNTSMHAIEEHVEPPYLFAGPFDFQVILADGSLTVMRVRRHNFAGWAQRYDRLAGVMGSGPGSGLRTGKVLQADCHLVEAALMWPAALAVLRRDPLFFVEAYQ
jgi:aminoglycoside 3-N-acetyltransferase